MGLEATNPSVAKTLDHTLLPQDGGGNHTPRLRHDDYLSFWQCDHGTRFDWCRAMGKAPAFPALHASHRGGQTVKELQLAFSLTLTKAALETIRGSPPTAYAASIYEEVAQCSKVQTSSL